MHCFVDVFSSLVYAWFTLATIKGRIKLNVTEILSLKLVCNRTCATFFKSSFLCKTINILWVKVL